MSANCIFCKIIAGQAPASLVYADEDVTAFRDISPQATTHILVVPNKHLVSLNDAGDDEIELLGKLLRAATRVAGEAGIAESGYRVVTNIGKNGRQSVDHLHFHVLGGNRLNARMT